MRRVLFEKADEGAKTPTRGSEGAAGYDLYACFNTERESFPFSAIPIGKRKLIPTKIKMVIPEGFYGRIAPRSGLAYKHGINVLAGVIDSDYRGEVGVILHNTDTEFDYVVQHGDAVAQIIFEKCFQPEMYELLGMEYISEFDTGRGAHGFGSTG